MVSTLMTHKPTGKATDQAQGPSDQELVSKVIRGDQEAFRHLVDRYSPRLFNLVGAIVRDRIEVEDVVQETFFKVYRKLSGFQGKSSFYTWLYRVAFNTATDHLKKKKNNRTHSIEEFEQIEPTAEMADPSQDLRRNELRRRLADSVAELPEKYRNILVLREYEDCSYDEIAEILGCSKGTVESRLFRARGRLRDKLKHHLT